MLRPGQKTRRRGFTLIEIMIVVGIMAIIVAIAVPAWLRARNTAHQRSCQENLSKIDGAKQQWALDNRATPGDSVALDVLFDEDGSGYLKKEPECPSNGDYTLGDVGTDTTCSITEEPYDHNANPGQFQS